MLCWPSHSHRPRLPSPTVPQSTLDRPFQRVSDVNEPQTGHLADIFSSSLVTDTFQSNGACQTTCKNYALGVLQGKRCWCTNVAPAKSSLADDTSDCDTGCPGYPSDSCGSASKAVYAYVAVSGNDVTSTAGGSTSSSTTSSTSSSVSTSSLMVPFSPRLFFFPSSNRPLPNPRASAVLLLP